MAPWDPKKRFRQSYATHGPYMQLMQNGDIMKSYKSRHVKPKQLNNYILCQYLAKQFQLY